MLRVGVVSEGISDFLVLQEVMRQVRPDAEFVHLHPIDTASLLGWGWTGVRAWCQRFGPELDLLMAEFPGGPLQLLVIHLDCSMAYHVEAHRPCPPAAATAEALLAIVEEQWLQRMPRHPAVVIATPAMTTDTWVVATLDPCPVDLAMIECDHKIETYLLNDIWGSIRRLRSKDGKVKKSRTAYQSFAALVGTNMDRVITRCPQAKAFRTEFSEAALVVST